MSRTVSPGRQQLICILADDSASMEGERAQAATQGIREMIEECGKRETGGSSLYKFLFITFSNSAYVAAGCNMIAARQIDLQKIKLIGGGGATNITAALREAIRHLTPYIAKLQVHPELAMHPIPLVLLFSDGEHNGSEEPEPVAREIKSLELDGDNVIIATVGIGLQCETKAEKTLQNIATPGCYLPAPDVETLRRFLAALGGLQQLASPSDIKKLMGLPHNPR